MARRIALMLCLALAPLPAVQAATEARASLADAGAALQDCAARLDADVDVGYARITQRCPQLPAQLAGERIQRWLPQGWQDPDNELSAGGLLELRALLVRESDLQAKSATPDVHALQALLSRLGPDRAVRGGWWRRIIDFLHELSGQPVPAGQPGWLARLVDRIGWSQVLMRALVYAGVGAVIGLAVLIIAQEVRASRGFSRSQRASGAREALLQGRRLNLADVELAPLLERPGLMLALIVQLRGEASGQAGLRSLTARELLRVPWLEPQAARQFESVALVAERVRYGSPPPREALEAAVGEGRTLLQRLAAQPVGVA